MLLAGDVGATKTRVAAISEEVGPHDPIAEKTYPSDKYASLQAVIDAFRDEHPRYTFTRASFGVAGPVVGGQAKITNLPWLMDEEKLRAQTGVERFTLLNDLEATAYGISALHADEFHTLNEGEAQPTGAIGVIAPGTGLGQGYLTWDDGKGQYIAHPSEGGHADFAPMNELQIELLRYMWQQHDHVSYEWVCSGLGIPNLYAFLKEGGYAEEPAWFATKLDGVHDSTPIISEAAYTTDEPLEIAVKTMELFVAILGAEAGNLALKVLATGGIYLGGGIPPRILPALEEGFMGPFLAKGRFSSLLEEIPVKVILNHKTALIGAANHAVTIT